MSDPLTLDEIAREVERTARGVPTADVRFRAACLFAAARWLRGDRNSTSSVPVAMARYGCEPGTRVDDTRVSAALDRAQNP